MRLGGIDIPHDRGMVGHSDADVLLHALTDALLGAASLGDIGELFPDTDPANRGRDSAEMLIAAYAKVRESGYRLVNADCIVFAVTRPPNVNVDEMVVMALAQSSGATIVRE